jgi:hypothetical protein
VLVAVVVWVVGAAGLVVPIPRAGAAGPDAVLTTPGCTTSTLARNDDGSTGLVPLGFTANYFGTSYSGLYVNNNGDVTFGSAYGGFSGLDLAASGRPIIAVAFYDVDTRPAQTTPVRYGPITYDGHAALCVNWVDVGYYSGGVDRLNSSQLVLVDRSDTGAGNFDIVMNYDRLVYEPGSGLTVGYSNGTSVSFTYPGSGSAGNLLDANTSTGLVHGSFGSAQLGRYVYPVRGGTPIAPGQQTVDFPQPSGVTFGVAPFTVAPTSSSGLPVALAAAGACTVSGSTVTVTGAGSCTLTATQAGDGGFDPATPVARTFAVAKAPVVVTLDGLAQVYDGTARTITASPAVPGVGTISVTYAGSATPPTAAGTYAVVATLTGADHTGTASGTLVVDRAPQAITLGPLPDRTFGSPPAVVSAGADSGLPVGLSATGSCAIDGATLALTGAGSCTVTASQAGDANHLPASTSQTFAVARAAAAIAIDGLAQTWDGAARPVEVATVPAGLTGVSVTYDGSSTPPTEPGAYAVEVTLSHAGYEAPPATATMVVGPADQTVSFAAPADRAWSPDTVAMSASASSRLPVRFTATGSCTVSGGAVTPTAAGACTVIAHQDGDAQHAPAPSVARAFAVLPAAQHVELAPIGDVVYGAPAVAVSATASSGLAAQLTVDGPCTVAGGSVTAVAAGRCTVTAHQGGDARFSAALPSSTAFTISPAPQRIDLVIPLAARLDEAAVPLTATATSGLAVELTVEGACTVSATAIVPVHAGTCTVTASQPGDHGWAAAPTATVSVQVLPGRAALRVRALEQRRDGTPRVAEVTTEPADLDGVTVTYDGSSTAPTRAGRYEVQATLDNPDWVAEPVTAELVVTAPPAPVAPGPLPPARVPEPVRAPSGVLPELVPGRSLVLSGGITVAATVEIVDRQMLRVTGVGFTASITAVDAGGRLRPVDAEGRLALEPGRVVALQGTGFVPSTSVDVWLFSTPTYLGAVTVSADGSFDGTLPVPELPAGSHTLQMNGLASGGETRSLSVGVVVDARSVAPAEPATRPVADPDAAPAATAGAATADAATDSVPVDDAGGGDEVAATATAQADRAASGRAALAPYDPASEPEAVVDTQVAAFTLVALAGTGAGLSSLRAGGGIAGGSIGGSGGSGGSGEGRRRSAKLTSAKVKHYKFRWEGQAVGDASRTWRWPGVERIDGLSRTLPVRLAPRAPLAGRLLTDGNHLRAMFGPLALLLPGAGALLGVVAAADTGGEALAPSAGIVLALVLLGIADAGAGAAAALTFSAVVVLAGGAHSPDTVRTLLGVAALCFAGPLIASAARPFRRPAPTSTAERLARAGDYVIAPLLGAWAVQKMTGALSGLAGVQLPITSHADTIALWALGAIVARLVVEDVVSHWYPERLATVSAEKMPFSTIRQRWAATGLRTAVFLFVAVAYLGATWQLWTGAALFALPQLVKIHDQAFPNRPVIYAVLPRGITKTVLMLFVGKWFGTLVADRISDPTQLILDGFILLTVPGLVLSLLDVSGRDPADPPEPASTLRTVAQHVAGAALVVLGIAFVFGRIG